MAFLYSFHTFLFTVDGDSWTCHENKKITKIKKYYKMAGKWAEMSNGLTRNANMYPGDLDDVRTQVIF